MSNNDQTTTIVLAVLHCDACINKTTQALAPLAAGVEVSLQTMQVVQTSAQADFKALKTAVESAGK